MDEMFRSRSVTISSWPAVYKASLARLEGGAIIIKCFHHRRCLHSYGNYSSSTGSFSPGSDAASAMGKHGEYLTPAEARDVLFAYIKAEGLEHATVRDNKFGHGDEQYFPLL